MSAAACPPESDRGATNAPRWATALVLLLAFAVFAPSIGNGFALDDQPLAGGEWRLQPGERDPVIGTLHSPGFYFSKFYWWMEYVNDGLYRPVTIYSFALTYNLVSAPFLSRVHEAVPHHSINVLLHVLATYLVLLLILRVGVRSIAAHVGAGLFAVHAIHSEAVAGVVGRAELLALCFGLGATLLFDRGTRAGAGGKRTAWYGLTASLLFLGYCSKESALAFGPFLFCNLLAQHWARQGADRSRPFTPGTPPWRAAAWVAGAPLVLFFALRSSAVAAHRIDLVDYVANPLWHTDTVTRVCTAIELWGYGLFKCLAPFHLSASYGAAVFEPSGSLFDLGVLAALLTLGGFLFVGLRCGRRHPIVFIAMASFLGLGFITSNLAFATGTIFAERLYYAPSLGVCALVAFGFDRLLSVQPRRLAPALGVACIWALGSVSVVLARNGAWRDSATLFLVEARNQPRSADMLVKAAGVLRAVGEADADRQAIAYLERALALVAEYPHALRERAALHLRRGAFDRALADYTRAWRSPYLELADTRSLAVAGMVEAWVGKGALPEPRELAPELALAVAGVLADAGRASDARRFLQSVASDPSASAALRERAAVISRAAPR